MTITTLTKVTTNAIALEMQAAAAAIAKKYGVEIKTAGGKFTATDADLKFKVVVKSEKAAELKDEKARKEFAMFAPWSGISADAFGKTLVVQGHKVTVTGWRSRAPKRPVVLTEIGTGKVFHAPVEVLTKQFPVKKAA